MAKYTDVNTDVGGTIAIFKLKELLKSAGWTVPSSSDGLTYNASGDQITHSSSGANGIANAGSWFRIRDPGDSHEWCFQYGSPSGSWRIKISPLDRFVGGSPGATQVPSATDGKILWGGGTDASPTYATIFGNWMTFKVHIIAQSTPVGNSPPVYGFWLFTTDNTTGAYYTMICQDPIDPETTAPLKGSRSNPESGDVDPVVYICGYDADIAEITTIAGSFGSSTTAGNAWFNYNYSGERIGSIGICFIDGYAGRYFQGNSSSDGLGANPYDGKEDMLPVIWAAPRGFFSYPAGYKGVSKYLRSRSVWRAWPSYPNTINLSSNSYVCLGDLLIPWEDGTTPLI